MGSTLGVVHRMRSQEEKLKIVRLRLEQNISPKELSKRFGVNPSLLSVWCKQYTEYGAERLRSQNGIPRLEPTIRKKKEQSIIQTRNSKNFSLTAASFLQANISKLMLSFTTV